MRRARTRSSAAITYLVLLMAALGAGTLLGGTALAQEQSTKIDCAGASLIPPPGFNANCFEGPFTQVGGQSYACRLSNVSFGFKPEGTDPRFHVRARYPKKGGKVCATLPFENPEDAMQHVHKLVENDAMHWSAMQAAAPDINVMFFDAKDQKVNGKCFTFIKLGPSAGYSGKGHLFTMIGFFCKAPGQPLDAAAAVALVNAVQLKTEQ
jgi:hypothetical protein